MPVSRPYYPAPQPIAETFATYLADVGIRVNYLLSPSFAVYGGYRLSDAAGEADEVHSPGLNNSANVGLRYRF